MPSSRPPRDKPTKPKAARREPPPAAKPVSAAGRFDFVTLGTRAVMACAVVGALTVVADWHSSGLIRRGEIDRMLRMSANQPRQTAEGPATRGKLDRGRLNALVATAAK